VFLYDNQLFEDPGREYSTQDVLNFLAQTYPELGNGTWTSRTLPDGSEEITFVKITGEKGSQINLFDPPQRPLLPGPVNQLIRRVFLYDNQLFEDPGREYSTQDVLNFLAQTYPELGNGTWTSRMLPDGSEEITFVKITGEKGSQVSLFDLPPERPLLPGPVSRLTNRVFLYDNQHFEDPGPEYSVQDVLNFLATTYPELGNGTWTSRSLPDGSQEITFVKVTGEKGSGNTVTPRHLITALYHLNPTEVKAITLLDQIASLETGETPKLDAMRLLAMTPAIESALQQAERISNDSQRIVRQCLDLTPIPHPKVPLGF
jgi:PRTRC genetic system protein C